MPTGHTMTQQARTSAPALTGPPSIRGISLSTSRWMCWAATLLITFCPTSGGAEAGPRAVVTPAYRIDLRSVVKGPFMMAPWSGPEGRYGTPIRSLIFLNDYRLAVTVVTQTTGKPELAARGAPSASSAFRLNAVIIDASSGKILDTPGWPSNSRYAFIVTANDRGFLTERGEELMLFDPDLRPIKRVGLPRLPGDQYGHDRFWTARPDWSGKRVALLGWVTFTKGPWLWLDAERLEILESWDEIGTGSVAVSEDRMVMSTASRHLGDPPPILTIRAPGGEWHPLPSTANPSGEQFVGPNLLYFHRFPTISLPSPSGAFLMRTDGGEPSRLEPPRKGWGLGQAAASRTGKRFAILVGETKGRHPALDISGYLVLRGFEVFDPPFSAPSSILEVRDSRIPGLGTRTSWRFRLTGGTSQFSPTPTRSLRSTSCHPRTEASRQHGADAGSDIPRFSGEVDLF